MHLFLAPVPFPSPAHRRCFDALANRLLELAWETYNDPPQFENPNKYHFGIADFSRVGFELLEHIFNAEHDTHCFILKDEPRAVCVLCVSVRCALCGSTPQNIVVLPTLGP